MYRKPICYHFENLLFHLLLIVLQLLQPSQNCFQFFLTDCAAPVSYPYLHSHPHNYSHPHFSAVGLLLINLRSTYLQHISIRNTSSIGLHAFGGVNLTIEYSSFFYNQFPVDNLADDPKHSFGANVTVFMSLGLSLHSNTSNKLRIVRINFIKFRGAAYIGIRIINLFG